MSYLTPTLSELLHLFLSSSGVTIDSRHLRAGSMFFALKGEKTDGHQFVSQALEAGASYVVLDDQRALKPDPRYLYVNHTLSALQALAKAYRATSIPHIPLAVVGGSNGKTTTKELMYAAVSQAYATFATPKNLNNHIGVPLCMLAIRPQQHERAIIEIGANHLGEHRLLCDITQPHIALITNCGKDHLEGYGDERGVLESAREITDYMHQHQGTLLLNADDALLKEVADEKTLYFGKQALAQPNIHYIARSQQLQEFPFLSVDIDGTPIQTKLFGNFQAYNVLAATALARLWKVSEAQIQAGIALYSPSQNRSQIIAWKSHQVLLDAYNANPSSMEAILHTFARYPAHTAKAVILGEMAELGEHTEKEHKHLLAYLDRMSFPLVILVGNYFKAHQPQYPHFHYFSHTQEAKAWMESQPFPPTFFLAKGSRSVALENLFL